MEQSLSTFLSDLFTKGEVTISPIINPIEETDQQQAIQLLQDFYEEDRQEMPADAPSLDTTAALWAAIYLYRIIQLILVRQLGEADIKAQLKAYSAAITPSIIYSVDLTFRYLPDLFQLAKGLAPSDLLVTYLQELAASYPFSSVGIELQGTVDHRLTLEHPSLKITYIDRLIAAKDEKRIQQYGLQEYVEEVVGTYKEALWGR